MKRIIVSIAAALFPWFLAFFTIWDMDVSSWTPAARAIALMFSVWVAAMAYFYPGWDYDK